MRTGHSLNTDVSQILICFLAASTSAFWPMDISSLQSRPLAIVPPAWAASIPDVEYARLANVRGLLQSQKYAAADEILTRSLELWQKSKQPAMEIATILKDRGRARQFNNPAGALADLNAALEIYAHMRSDERPLDEVMGATFLRAQVNQRLSDLEAAEHDYTTALNLDEENPFIWSARGENRLRREDWTGAAQDFLQAETQFKLIGKICGVLPTPESVHCSEN